MTWHGTCGCHAGAAGGSRVVAHRTEASAGINSVLREKLTQKLLLISHTFIVSQISLDQRLSLSHRFCAVFLLLLNYLLVRFWTRLIKNSLGQNAATPYAHSVHAISSHSCEELFSMCLNTFFRNKMTCCKRYIQFLFYWGRENLQATKRMVLTYKRIKSKGTTVYEMH